MNFFKSVFSDDPTPSDSDDSSSAHDPSQQPSDPAPAPAAPNSGHTSGAAWSFGGLIKTIATKSESVIESYRRDLEEFGSELKKETAVIREAASRAVQDLPASLDAGASVAQDKLETVGQAIDDIGSTVWKSTAEIISHSKEVLLELDSDSSENSSSKNYSSSPLDVSSSQVLDVKKYSRFDAQLRAIQSDVGTYCDEPDDLDDYREWKLGFALGEKSDEIESLIRENGAIEEIYREVVPAKVDNDGFWGRYFYKVNKFKQAEEARARLVKRAISGDEEEDLSWDFDDEDEEGGSNSKGGGFDSEKERTGTPVLDDVKNDSSAEPVMDSDPSKAKLEAKIEERECSEEKNDSSESCKDSDLSIVSSQPSMAEEGWDEIEDIVANDESQTESVSTTSRVDLRKRLTATAADDEEDLSWDIEDDDESPTKA